MLTNNKINYKLIFTTIIVLICVGALIFILLVMNKRATDSGVNNTVYEQNTENSNPCTLEEFRASGGESMADCFVRVGGSSQDIADAKTLPIQFMAVDGEITNAVLPKVSVNSDNTFLLPSEGKITVLGSKSLKIPAYIIAPGSPSTKLSTITKVPNTVDSVNPTNSSVPPNPTPTNPAGPADPIGPTGPTGPTETVFIPIVQDPPSGSSTSGDEPGNFIGYYDNVKGEYVLIDLAWLGYFKLDSFDVRSYTPPEIRVSGTKNGTPFQLSLILDENYQIRTLVSTHNEIFVYE